MRMVANTTYCQVQAIRRAYRDAGVPTFAKAGAYQQIVNFAGTLAGEVARGTVQIDGDSDFLWTHTYHYFQNAIFDPAVGSTAANNNSGQFLDLTGAFLVDVRVQRSGGRVIHDVDFAFDLFGDGFYASVNGLPGSFSDESELMGVGVAGVVGGTDNNNAISLYRSANVDPIILARNAILTLAVRRRFALATRPFRGHVFVLSGVRLFPIGR